MYYNSDLIIIYYMMNDEIKKYKLYFLQIRYNKLTNILNRMNHHVDNLNNLYTLHSNEINSYLGKIYELIKNLNTYYNEHINIYFNDDATEINFILNHINTLDTTNIIPIIKAYETEIPNQTTFLDTEDKIYDLINKYGYDNIVDMLEIIFNIKAKKYFSTVTNCLLEEINEICIPIGFDIFDVSNETKDYYWRIPTKYYESDILEKTRELWLKLPNKNNEYIRINIVFKMDRLSSIIKTCQINNPLLYDKKLNVLNNLETINQVNIKFVKTLIRHDYLGNIYCYEIDEYIEYLINLYYKYSKLVESTFITLMKDFVATSDNIKKMYDIIFLLLLGNDESIDIAGLLLGLLKEKKGNSKYQLYYFLYNNLTYYLQSKIKKSNSYIKNELDNIKNIVLEEVDYKKQLVINKSIPGNVKTLVLEKIEEMNSFNNEYYKQLTYVKTIINYPWSSPNDDIFFKSLSVNNNKAKDYLTTTNTNLQKLCYGHDEAKKSLIQIIGKWISNPSSHGPSLGFVGPPGVGKTLLAKSVSKALDIPFRQITLGGQNDGELLHGHGYTYSGSQPGLIVKKMVEMGKSRCILYFDELDKACCKHGSLNEITSILIHLTDPNMNKSFQDRFFQGIEFPLDKVIMIFSYNDSSLVDPILLDRIKEIKVAPYTLNDKLKICQQYIVPEIIDTLNFSNMINISDNVLEYIIDNYTNEAGVREIKRKLEDIFLELNLDKIYCKNLFKNSKKNKFSLTETKINKILSPPTKERVIIHTEPKIGIINGLYATTTGDGGIIPIQVFPNLQSSCDKYEIKLTGKQGDVMKESVLCSLTAALEYLKINYQKYNIDNLDDYMNKYLKHGFHVHTPSTSTPKDGPSAGCAFTSAFISRIVNIPIKNDVGMTGEIDLTGQITKIGGLEFKLLGAKKAGIKQIYIPFENKKDLEEINKKYTKLISKDFCVKTFTNISEIIDEILIK